MFFRTSKINKNAGLPRGTKWSGGFTQSLENGFVPTKVGTVRPKPFFSAGFTLIEMMTVIVIATIVITALVVQQNKWNDQLTVSTQAYELALMIRQAQIYSLGVREDTGGSGDRFDIGYGVHLYEDYNDRYVFFADRDGDFRYDGSASSCSGECLEMVTLKRGVTIEDVCGDDKCFYSNGGPLQKVNVSFLRPSTAARVNLLNNGGNEVDDPPVVIKLKSPGDRRSSIKVEENGQVFVDDL